MKKILYPFILFLFLSSTAFSQKGELFPSLEGETIDNKAFTIPEDSKGKYTILGLSWSNKSEDDWNTWLQPVYDKFINSNNFMQTSYDINIYFIAMFTGLNKTAYKGVVEKSKKRLGKDAASYLLFYKGKLKEYKQKLNLGNKDTPHFYVLDETGKIVYIATGRCSDEKIDEIEAILPEE
ncbi:MAG: hypothetical protein J5I47_13245 [Vicingus serpentipes]|nr:hypothetical protein [Vicingus serpentipes]